MFVIDLVYKASLAEIDAHRAAHVRSDICALIDRLHSALREASRFKPR